MLIGCLRIGPDPRAWITTTPSGLNWIYRLFVLQEVAEGADRFVEDAQGNKRPLYERFHVSIDDNRRNLDPHYYDSLRASYTGRFARQELYGEFVSMEGLVYDEFGPENISDSAEYRIDTPVEWAFDDGYTNPRVILFIQRMPNGDVHIFDELYHTRRLAGESLGEALERPYARPELAVGDPSAAEFRETLRQADIIARGAKCEIIESIKVVRRLICDGRGYRTIKVHPRCRNLIREMTSYAYPEGSDVRNETEKPEKANDHAPDALRYWCWMRARH